MLNSEKGKNKVSDEKPDNLARIDVPRWAAITRRVDQRLLKMWMLENDQLVETRSEGPRMGHTDPREK